MTIEETLASVLHRRRSIHMPIRMMRRLVHSIILFAVVGCAHPADTRAQLRREIWGFTGPWDAASNTSLRDFGGKLDAVITGWIALDSATALPILPALFPDT